MEVSDVLSFLGSDRLALYRQSAALERGGPVAQEQTLTKGPTMPANLTPGDTLILPDGKYIAVLDSGGTLVFGSLIQRPDGNLTLGYLDPPPAGMTYNPHYFVTRGYTEPHLSPGPAPVDPEALTALDLSQPDSSLPSKITYYEPKEVPQGRRENVPLYTPCTNATVTALGTGTANGRGTTVAGGLMMSSASISHIEILGRN